MKTSLTTRAVFAVLSIFAVSCSSDPTSTGGEDRDGGQLDAELDAALGSDAGSDSDATLGNDAGSDSDVGVGVVPPSADLSVGLEHTCVLQPTGELSCFGRGDDGRLGYGDTEDIGVTDLPSAKGFVSTGTLEIRRIEAGEANTCALTVDGDVYCWGWGNHGRNGNGTGETFGDNEVPADLPALDLGDVPVIQISLSAGPPTVLSFTNPNSSVSGHACALRQDGAVYCWGENYYGQLGYGNTANVGDDETPASVGPVDLGGFVTQIAVGGRHTCALFQAGTVKCWGGSFALGYGNSDAIGDDELPSTVGFVDLGPGVVTQISAGTSHMCAVFDDGSLSCWGSGAGGALGYGNSEMIGDDEKPVAAGRVDVGGPVVAVSAGDDHTCVLDSQGRIKCWGDNNFGELGTGALNKIGDDELPSSIDWIDTGAEPAIAVSAGRNHTCAMFEDARVKCWGHGERIGQGSVRPNIGDDETPAEAGFVDLLP